MSSTVEKLEADLRKAEVAGLVTISETEQKIVLKPIKYLGSDNFGKVSQVVKDYYGNYVSKKNGGPHFEVPKKQDKQKQKPTVDYVSWLNGIIDELTRLRDELKEAS